VLEDVSHDLGRLFEKSGEEMVLFLTAGFKTQEKSP
jgi:hypothetical protein